MSAKVLRGKLEELFKLREVKQGLEKSLKIAKSSYSELEEHILDLMLDDEVQSLGIEDVALFSVSRSEHPRCVDNDVLRKHLIDSGDDGMLTMNPNTLKSWWRNDLTDAERKDPSKYGLAVFTKSRINITAK